MSKIIVTGASGWMGRVTLEYLQEECGVDVERDVTCFSSVSRDIILRNGISLRSAPLESLVFHQNSVEGIFHFAFLTRDYVKKLGTPKYLELNQNILKTMETFLSSIDFKWVISVSSGAVFDPGTHSLAQNSDSNPYGYLKLAEEKLLHHLAETKGATAIVGRLWACTGLDMPIDEKYAISNFILQALTEKKILINSTYEVWRRYIDANDFISILHKLTTKGESTILDSAGSLVELGELASMVGFATNALVSRAPMDKGAGPDNYFPDGLVMSRKASSLGITLQTMQEQVERTIRGHVQKLPIYLKEYKS